MSVSMHEEDLGTNFYLVPANEEGDNNEGVIIVEDHLIQRSPETCRESFLEDLQRPGSSKFSPVRHEVRRSKPVDSATAVVWFAYVDGLDPREIELSRPTPPVDPVGLLIFEALEELKKAENKKVLLAQSS